MDQMSSDSTHHERDKTSKTIDLKILLCCACAVTVAAFEKSELHRAYSTVRD